MSWQSRIQLRRDRAAQWAGPIPHMLEPGEMAVAFDSSGGGQIRIGTSPRQAWSQAARVIDFGPGLAPLMVEDNPSLVTGDLIAYDSGKPVAGAKQIDFDPNRASGAVVYTHATATFSTDPSVVLTTDLDGGSYKGPGFIETTAPEFAVSYSPQIGGSGTTEPYSEPTFAPSYQPSLGQA